MRAQWPHKLRLILYRKQKSFNGMSFMECPENCPVGGDTFVQSGTTASAGSSPRFGIAIQMPRRSSRDRRVGFRLALRAKAVQLVALGKQRKSRRSGRRVGDFLQGVLFLVNESFAEDAH